MFSPLFPAAINHLLKQEPWAREKLLAHVGKVACLDAQLFRQTLRVCADGLLESLDDTLIADVTIRVKAADLPLVAQNRERAAAYIKVEGDADFAHVIAQLGQGLRWEAEHDLQQWVGEITAMRMVGGAKAMRDMARESQIKVAENLAEYFLEENPMLVRPLAVADLTAEVAKMRDDVERLTKRIEKLGHKLGHGM